ncbi:hypothetical protein [Paraburkholderia sp. J63]|nr:hypothetical protein [Paraburkholderia sp. J63]
MNAAKPEASAALAYNKPGRPIGSIAGVVALVVVPSTILHRLTAPPKPSA